MPYVPPGLGAGPALVLAPGGLSVLAEPGCPELVQVHPPEFVAAATGGMAYGFWLGTPASEAAPAVVAGSAAGFVLLSSVMGSVFLASRLFRAFCAAPYPLSMS